MITWLASYPRSGNTLFRTILFKVFGVKSGSVFPEEHAVAPLLRTLSLRTSPDSLEQLRTGERLHFVKTHNLAEAADPSPAVYLVRDGRDALVSYAHFVKEKGLPGFHSRSFEETVAALARQNGGFGSWSANVRRWTSRDAPTAIVRFEELLDQPVETVKHAVEALGLPLPAPVGGLPAFPELQPESAGLLRRGEVGSWRTELPGATEDLFWEMHGEEMHALGYPREHPDAPLAPLRVEPSALRQGHDDDGM